MKCLVARERIVVLKVVRKTSRAATVETVLAGPVMCIARDGIAAVTSKWGWVDAVAHVANCMRVIAWGALTSLALGWRGGSASSWGRRRGLRAGRGYFVNALTRRPTLHERNIIAVDAR